MPKFEIKIANDSKNHFFCVFKDGVISFQSESNEKCAEYVLKEKRKISLALFEYNDFELSKLSVEYAKKREMAIGYDNCDYHEKDEREYHILNIYLDRDADDDGCIMYKIHEFKNGEFYAEFYSSIYGKESDKIIKEIMPKVIHGEKELRKAIKLLENRRKELLDME